MQIKLSKVECVQRMLCVSLKLDFKQAKQMKAHATQAAVCRSYSNRMQFSVSNALGVIKMHVHVCMHVSNYYMYTNSVFNYHMCNIVII